MIKPNFFIIGAVKCATTTLARLLEQHPQAAIGKHKEPHFFSIKYDGPGQMDSYLALYQHCTTEMAIGDASTSYSRIRYYPQTIKRIYDFDPDAKIIFIVRHPLKRIESAYAERIVTANAQNFQSLNQSVRQIPMMVDSSRYWEVFDAYRQIFPEKNILIVWFEELTKNQQKVFSEICLFLGIDAPKEHLLSPVHTNSRADKEQQINAKGLSIEDFNTQWDDDTRSYVIDQLRDDNLKLLKYFGKPEDYWGNLFC